jgi:acetylornithine deacetylase
MRYSPREMLERLIAFPTVSRDSNLPLIAFVRDYLAGHGVESRIVPNAEGDKANLYAQIGPDVPGGVVLSGHTDVVPVDGQAWSSDPFTLTERDGRLYGRGSCDMKGFDAIALALVPEMLAAGLTRPIQIALSYDEELGLLGAPSMIAEMRQTLPPASAVFVGEPSMMAVVTRQKGGLGTRTHVRGFPVHSSLVHTGVSAVMQAARLVNWHTERMADNRKAAEAAGPDAPGAAFDPPYTTLHVGVIEGGTANNITAKDCFFNAEVRCLPEDSNDDWLERYRQAIAAVAAEMQAIRPETGIDLTVRANSPGCQKEPAGSAHAEMLARALTGDNAEHAVSYGTEAGLFQAAGYSVCICGPGSIEQAHQADEYIEIAQLAAGEAFIRNLIERLSA